MCYFFLSNFSGCWVISNFVIFQKITVAKHRRDLCCHLAAETGSWFPLIRCYSLQQWKCSKKLRRMRNVWCDRHCIELLEKVTWWRFSSRLILWNFSKTISEICCFIVHIWKTEKIQSTFLSKLKKSAYLSKLVGMPLSMQAMGLYYKTF
jgi:hypothetical protein